MMSEDAPFLDAACRHIACGNCKAERETPSMGQSDHYAFSRPDSWYYLEGPEGTAFICSLTCLTDLAWKLREAQPKLSKSKATEESQ